jgi:hypothetical protein
MAITNARSWDTVRLPNLVTVTVTDRAMVRDDVHDQG